MQVEDNLLLKIQGVGRDMLKYFDDFCQENDIPYFVMYGTGIGAIRHSDFIPWDDDVDVGMLRKDYDRFHELFNALETEDYYLIDPLDNDLWHEKIFPRIYKRGTIFESKDWHDTYVSTDCSRPVWLDIFVFDYADSIDEIKKKEKEVKFLKWLFTYSKYKVRVNRKNIIISLIKRHIYYILHWIPNRDLLIYKTYVSIISKKSSGRYLVSYDSWSYNDLMGSICTYEDIFPLKRVKYADFKVNIQNEYDKVLSKIYGEYMLLPPEDSRKAHPPYHVEL